MEIKTCEQYVTSRIMDLENKVDQQKDIINMRMFEIQALEDKLELIVQAIKPSLCKSHDYSEDNKSTYIEFRNVWSKYDPEKFKVICEFFGLDETMEEE